MSRFTFAAASGPYLHPWAHTAECAEWCRANGIEPDDTYQITVDTERMMATVYQYERNEAGRFFGRDQDGKLVIAKRDPFEVALKTLPSIAGEVDMALCDSLEADEWLGLDSIG